MYSTLLFSVSFPVFCSRTEFPPSPFLGLKTLKQSGVGRPASWVRVVRVWDPTVSVASVTTALTVVVFVQIHPIRRKNGVYYKLLLGDGFIAYGEHLKRSFPDFQDGVVLLSASFCIVVLSSPSFAVRTVPREQRPIPVHIPTHQSQEGDGYQGYSPTNDGRQW